MSTLRILNSKGDTAVSWAPERLATRDAEAEAAVKAAERIFAKALAQGATAFRVVDGGDSERVDVFNPNIEADMVIVPRIAGG